MGWSMGLAGPVPFVHNLYLACSFADLHKSCAVQPINVDSFLSLMSVTIGAATVKKPEVIIIIRQGNS